MVTELSPSPLDQRLIEQIESDARAIQKWPVWATWRLTASSSAEEAQALLVEDLPEDSQPQVIPPEL